MFMTNAIATLMTTAGAAIALSAAGLLSTPPTPPPADGPAPIQARIVFAPDDQPKGLGTQRSVVTMIEKVGDRTIEVKVVDGKASATINGKPVDADRIKQQGDTYFILDGDGREITRMVLLPSPTPPTGAWPGEARSIERGVLRPGLAPAEPRYIIGVNISTVSAELKDHLGITGEAIRVESVMEGMPAEKAGLKAGDLIVSINGSDGVDAQTLSQTISKTRGEKPVKLKIIRQGQPMAVTVTPTRAGEVARLDRPSFEREIESIQSGSIRELEVRIAQQREAIEQMARSVPDQQQRERLEANARELGRMLERLAVLRDNPNAEFMLGAIQQQPGGEVFRWSTPNAPAAPSLPGVFRFEQADPQHIERINKRLDSIEARMERIERMLERALDR